MKKLDRLLCGSEISALIPHQVDCGWQGIVHLHAVKRAALIIDADCHALRGGPAQLDSIFHFLSGSLAVNAYAAFSNAGRFSQ